jgi:hypothetical protein
LTARLAGRAGRLKVTLHALGRITPEETAACRVRRTMPDEHPAERASSPPRETPSGETPSREPRPRHRAIVWSLIVLASVLLVFSITANWIQAEALNTDWVVDSTDEILATAEVQEALAIYTVDQLYANVDVQGEIDARLPGPAKALAAPAAVALRQLALDLERDALASPRVQGLISATVGVGHRQFVALVANESQYVSKTGGAVTLDYGKVIADLAARLGVDPGTISRVQGVVRDLSGLEPRLAQLQARIAPARAELARVQRGEPSPQAQQRLQSLQQGITELQAGLQSLQRAVATVRGKAPPRLRARLVQLGGRLSDLEDRIAAANRAIPATLDRPDPANVAKVDGALARVQTRLATLLGREVVQNPGELVVTTPTQLDEVQALFKLLRNLGFVLPLLVLVLYAGALLLAKG